MATGFPGLRERLLRIGIARARVSDLLGRPAGPGRTARSRWRPPRGSSRPKNCWTWGARTRRPSTPGGPDDAPFMARVKNERAVHSFQYPAPDFGARAVFFSCRCRTAGTTVRSPPPTAHLERTGSPFGGRAMANAVEPTPATTMLRLWRARTIVIDEKLPKDLRDRMLETPTFSKRWGRGPTTVGTLQIGDCSSDVIEKFKGCDRKMATKTYEEDRMRQEKLQKA